MKSSIVFVALLAVAAGSFLPKDTKGASTPVVAVAKPAAKVAPKPAAVVAKPAAKVAPKSAAVVAKPTAKVVKLKPPSVASTPQQLTQANHTDSSETDLRSYLS